MWCTLGSMYVKWKTWMGWSTKTWLFKSVSTWHTVSTYTVIRGTHQSISSSICNCSNIIHAFYYVQVIVNTLFYYKIQFVNQVKKYTKWIQFDQYMLLSNNAKRHVKCLYLWSFKYYHLYFMNIEYLGTYRLKNIYRTREITPRRTDYGHYFTSWLPVVNDWFVNTLVFNALWILWSAKHTKWFANLEEFKISFENHCHICKIIHQCCMIEGFLFPEQKLLSSLKD